MLIENLNSAFALQESDYLGYFKFREDDSFIWIPLPKYYSVPLSRLKLLLPQGKCIRSLCSEILTAKKSELLFLTLTSVVVSDKSLSKPVAAQQKISGQDGWADLCRIHSGTRHSSLDGNGQKGMVDYITIR